MFASQYRSPTLPRQVFCLCYFFPYFLNLILFYLYFSYLIFCTRTPYGLDELHSKCKPAPELQARTLSLSCTHPCTRSNTRTLTRVRSLACTHAHHTYILLVHYAPLARTTPMTHSAALMHVYVHVSVCLSVRVCVCVSGTTARDKTRPSAADATDGTRAVAGEAQTVALLQEMMRRMERMEAKIEAQSAAETKFGVCVFVCVCVCVCVYALEEHAEEEKEEKLHYGSSYYVMLYCIYI